MYTDIAQPHPHYRYQGSEGRGYKAPKSNMRVNKGHALYPS